MSAIRPTLVPMMPFAPDLNLGAAYNRAMARLADDEWAVLLDHDMLFWGARNIDGRGFDKEENRPTNLQIPLVRKQPLICAVIQSPEPVLSC